MPGAHRPARRAAGSGQGRYLCLALFHVHSRVRGTGATALGVSALGATLFVGIACRKDRKSIGLLLTMLEGLQFVNSTGSNHALDGMKRSP